MRANKRANTLPETRVRSELHARGFRFRKHLRIATPNVSVRPDIVFTRLRLAVFIDGCFWHGCEEHGTKPRANADYWSAKISRNQKRDRAVTEALQDAGWTVLRLWEHVVADEAADAIDKELSRLQLGSNRGS